MRLFPGLQISQSALRLATAGVAVMLLAGCSSDSTRLAGIGIGGETASDLTPTASIPTAGGQRPQRLATMSSPAIQSQPLAPITSKPLAPPNPSFVAPAANSPQLHRQTASLAPATTASTLRPVSGWSAEGGTAVTVAQGETAAGLAGRYGIPADALLHANGFTSASQVQPGTRLIIPVYNAAAAGVPARPAAVPVKMATPARISAPAAPAIAAPALAATPRANERLHLVQGAPAAAPALKAVAPRPGQLGVAPVKAVKPALLETKPVAAKQVDAKAALDAAAARQADMDAKKAAADARKAALDAKKQAALDARKTQPVDRETTTASVPVVAAAPAAKDDADKPEFRWPARGRVIQGFKAGANDGINIALPEGTSVKAAEAGTVAYAGSELKGYGNLVLIRHPNGFVSAYANNGDISVKRGDQVKRGQIIAKSGQSGNVNAPQLHFELRKGSTPVDPTNFLANNL